MFFYISLGNAGSICKLWLLSSKLCYFFISLKIVFRHFAYLASLPGLANKNVPVLFPITTEGGQSR
jgi:hypothetical protein